MRQTISGVFQANLVKPSTRWLVLDDARGDFDLRHLEIHKLEASGLQRFSWRGLPEHGLEDLWVTNCPGFSLSVVPEGLKLFVLDGVVQDLDAMRHRQALTEQMA